MHSVAAIGFLIMGFVAWLAANNETLATIFFCFSITHAVFSCKDWWK